MEWLTGSLYLLISYTVKPKLTQIIPINTETKYNQNNRKTIVEYKK